MERDEERLREEREILGQFGGLYRRYADEARMIEKSEGLRRVA